MAIGATSSYEIKLLLKGLLLMASHRQNYINRCLLKQDSEEKLYINMHRLFLNYTYVLS